MYRFSSKKISAAILLLVFLAGAVFYLAFISVPRDFPEGAVVRIENGQTLQSVSRKLKDNNIIRSRQWFSNFVHILDNERSIIAGDYFFPAKESVFSIAQRMSEGDFGFDPIKITIPEGLTIKEVSLIYDDKLPNFDSQEFLRISQAQEGYLFPDTYFFPPTADETTVVSRMTIQFDRQIKRVEDELNSFNKPLEDVMIMASILEEEAQTMKDRRIVAGLLWKRLEIGMPLQVDASFIAINGKTSSELTREDLGIDSPYNTYKYKGLPPAPISSPGLDSIRAAATPIDTEYFYYLSEEDGTIHYAETLDDHNDNKALYID